MVKMNDIKQVPKVCPQPRGWGNPSVARQFQLTVVLANARASQQSQEGKSKCPHTQGHLGSAHSGRRWVFVLPLGPLLFLSAETLRQELEREKMMKRLLMTELWDSALAAWRWHGAFVRFLSSGSVCSLRHDVQKCALSAQVSRVSGSQLPAWLRWESYFYVSWAWEVFLLLNAVETGFGRKFLEERGFLFSGSCVYLLVTPGANAAQNPPLIL